MGVTNTNWPFGLEPAFSDYGDGITTFRAPLRQAVQAATPQVTAIYKGCPVERNTTTGAVRPVASATLASMKAYGVAAEYYAGSAGPGKTTKDIAIWPSKGNTFRIMHYTATTSTVAAGLFGKNFAGISFTAGNTTTGVSKGRLGAATSADVALRCVGPAFSVKDGDGAYMPLLVKFNFGHDALDVAT